MDELPTHFALEAMRMWTFRYFLAVLSARTLPMTEAEGIDEETQYVCACGEVFGPEDLGHSMIQVGTSGFRCVKEPCNHAWYNLPGNYTRKCEKCEMEENIR